MVKILRTNAVTEGAMSVTIIVLLNILNSIFGFFSFLIPIPIAVLVYRHNLKTGAVVSLVAALLVSLILVSPLFGLDLMITSIVGIALGLALKEDFKFTSLFIVGVGTSIIASLLRISSFSVISGFNAIDTYLETMNDVSQQTLAFLENMGISEQFLMQYAQELAVLPSLFKMLIPLLLLCFGMVETIIALFFLKIVLNRLGVSIPKAPPFIAWKWPWYFVWGFILSKAMLIAQQYYTNDVLQVIIVNIDMFFSGAFFIQGLAIVWSFLTKAHLSKFFMIFLAVVLLMSGNVIIYYFLIMFGVLDTWFDFRKLKL